MCSRSWLVAPAPLPRGLTAAMRRVREYIEAHLHDSIELVELAATRAVDLSFRTAVQAIGRRDAAPLRIQSRIERAQELLAVTDLSLSEIAFTTGFSDQSHLTRHFRQLIGVTPGQFRWSLR
jgi:transcriptional regulator GlxA family with amidase domain